MAPGGTLGVRDLGVAYRTALGRVVAADKVSFEVCPGEAVALIGESGSGKSTVALGLVRLLPANAEITGGEIHWQPAGEPPRDVLRMSDRELRAFRWETCALVPQGAISALNPVMRVAEHFVDTAAAHGSITGAALERRAADLLATVRLEPRRIWQSYPHELSGGMRQRVLIALALLLEPRVLILDEPTTALDVLTQRSILDLLVELRRGSSFSILLVTHDLGVAAEVCDRVVTMYAGRVIESAPTAEAMIAPRHPYTQALLRAIPSLDADDQAVVAIPGSPPDLVGTIPGCPFAPRCSYATEVCRTDEPLLEPVGPAHVAACHHWRAVGDRVASGEAVHA